ncbi:hypothetical protein ACE193_22225 [Bernardetia sp. OM2101]|uniref:hypothetical protein n=1 Tax=Bernardetia sp. OM2101 TaxID=3344876 RepID=UPI0035CEA2CA
MYIHKIDSTLETHQNFLAQNRKDPITGDSISEGDEVVFCAGCKSVFFKDTWEYLGNQHCQQSKTLKTLPSTSIHIRVGEDILYYQFIEKDNETGVLEIRKDYKNWLYKEANTGRFRNLFYGKKKNLYQFGIGLGLFLLLIPLNLLIANEVFIIFSIALLVGLFPILNFFHQENYETKINTKYSEISSKAFIIKPQGIAISEPYGIRENFLPNKHIKAITLSKLNFFLKN